MFFTLKPFLALTYWRRHYFTDGVNLPTSTVRFSTKQGLGGAWQDHLKTKLLFCKCYDFLKALPDHSPLLGLDSWTQCTVLLSWNVHVNEFIFEAFGRCLKIKLLVWGGGTKTLVENQTWGFFKSFPNIYNIDILYTPFLDPSHFSQPCLNCQLIEQVTDIQIFINLIGGYFSGELHGYGRSLWFLWSKCILTSGFLLRPSVTNVLIFLLLLCHDFPTVLYFTVLHCTI